MELLVTILAALSVLLSVCLLFIVLQLYRQAGRLQQRVDDGSGLAPMPPNRTLIGIEILNPFELAEQDSRLARPLIAMAPGVIRRIVYRRTRETLIPQLAERGVRADVRVYRSEDGKP